MRNPGIALTIAILPRSSSLAAAPAFTQNKSAATKAPEAAAVPDQSSLVVGALQIGSAPNLVIPGVDISVAVNSIVYSYYFENNGFDGTRPHGHRIVAGPASQRRRQRDWLLASNDPENPIGLTIIASGAPVTTTAEVHAYALGLDRVAEIKAEHLPLIPFGPALDKALAALSPEAAARLAALGAISPRDPAEPQAPAKADWTLEVVRIWRQVLPPGKTTPIVVKFIRSWLNTNWQRATSRTSAT